MGNRLATFDFNNATIRTAEIDGKPWFVARDVYLVLFGRTTGVNHITKVLAPDQKTVLEKARVPDTLTPLFAGTQHRLAVISEGGLYKLIMRSDKPEAREFQDWVTRVVLPAIRKDGGYIAGEAGGLKIQTARKAAHDLKDAEVQHVAKSNVTAGDVSFPNRGMLCVNDGRVQVLQESKRT